MPEGRRGGTLDLMSTHQPATTTRSTAASVARLAGAAVALGVFAAAMWFAWLGWDHEYYQVDGVAQGPYRAWQVIGVGLSIAVAAVLAYVWVRGVWAIFVLAAAAIIGFAVPWTLDAASNDDTGEPPILARSRTHAPRVHKLYPLIFSQELLV